MSWRVDLIPGHGLPDGSMVFVATPDGMQLGEVNGDHVVTRGLSRGDFTSFIEILRSGGEVSFDVNLPELPNAQADRAAPEWADPLEPRSADEMARWLWEGE
jgi:hypothetical protein